MCACVRVWFCAESSSQQSHAKQSDHTAYVGHGNTQSQPSVPRDGRFGGNDTAGTSRYSGDAHHDNHRQEGRRSRGGGSSGESVGNGRGAVKKGSYSRDEHRRSGGPERTPNVRQTVSTRQENSGSKGAPQNQGGSTKPSGKLPAGGRSGSLGYDETGPAPSYRSNDKRSSEGSGPYEAGRRQRQDGRKPGQEEWKQGPSQSQPQNSRSTRPQQSKPSADKSLAGDSKENIARDKDAVTSDKKQQVQLFVQSFLGQLFTLI